MPPLNELQVADTVQFERKRQHSIKNGAVSSKVPTFPSKNYSSFNDHEACPLALGL